MSGAPDAQRRNRATPEVMALLLDRFRHDSLFASEYRDFLWQTLCTTTTGMNKLRAGLPDGTTIGHKTGSSDRDARGVKIADNDLGYVELPDGSGYAICVYVAETALSDGETAALIAEISRLVWLRRGRRGRAGAGPSVSGSGSRDRIRAGRRRRRQPAPQEPPRVPAPRVRAQRRVSSLR